jgi:serine O-acetyltransferase
MENNFLIKTLLKYHKGLHKKTGIRSFFFNFIVQIIYGGYISERAEIGNNVFFPHGFNCIFISGKVKILNNCIIYQNVTIGSDEKGGPLLSDDCMVGAGAILIGKIIIGKGCKIGAGFVIQNDIPDYSTVVPQKSRIILRVNDDTRVLIA